MSCRAYYLKSISRISSFSGVTDLVFFLLFMPDFLRVASLEPKKQQKLMNACWLFQENMLHCSTTKFV